MHPSVLGYTFWEVFGEYDTDNNPSNIFNSGGSLYRTGSYVDMIYNKYLQINEYLPNGDYEVIVSNNREHKRPLRYINFTINGE